MEKHIDDCGENNISDDNEVCVGENQNNIKNKDEVTHYNKHEEEYDKKSEIEDGHVDTVKYNCDSDEEKDKDDDENYNFILNLENIKTQFDDNDDGSNNIKDDEKNNEVGDNKKINKNCHKEENESDRV